jgi:hypothetical protein
LVTPFQRNGLSWRKEGRQLLADKVEDESQAFPTVARFDGKYHMAFSYRHRSIPNQPGTQLPTRLLLGPLICGTGPGTTPSLILDMTQGDWDSDMRCYPCIFEMDGQVYLLYNGNEFGRYGFGLARLESR